MAFKTTVQTILALAIIALFAMAKAQTPIFTTASAQRAELDNELSFDANAIEPAVLEGNVTAQAGNVGTEPSLALPDVMVAFNLANIPSGEVFPIHLHPRGTEIIFNIVGQQQITITQENGEPLVFDTKPGFFTAIPEGLPHVTACVGPEDCMFSAAFNTADPGTLFLEGVADGADVSPAPTSS